MIGEITDAVLKECKELLQGTGAEVIFKTNLNQMSKETYSGNFVLLDILDAPDSKQYPGGLTQMEWKYCFNSYNFEPDSFVDDVTGYSTDLLNFIDTIRQHFSSAQGNDGWLTDDMRNVQEQYGFQFTFGGLTVAEAVEKDGIVMGYKIDMETTALDAATLYLVQSGSVLEHVNQVGNPPFQPPVVS